MGDRHVSKCHDLGNEYYLRQTPQSANHFLSNKNYP